MQTVASPIPVMVLTGILPEIMTETVDLLTSRQTLAQQPTAATSEPANSSVATPGADNDYPF